MFPLLLSVFEIGSLTGPMLLDLDRMSGHRAPRIYLSPPPQCWDYTLILLWLAFLSWVVAQVFMLAWQTLSHWTMSPDPDQSSLLWFSLANMCPWYFVSISSLSLAGLGLQAESKLASYISAFDGTIVSGSDSPFCLLRNCSSIIHCLVLHLSSLLLSSSILCIQRKGVHTDNPQCIYLLSLFCLLFLFQELR